MEKETIKIIKDPVHNYIKLNEDDLKIIDTPLFQRLRNIHHLGTGFLTYPGATHTRFEHSLGVMQLGDSALFNTFRNSSEFWTDDAELRNKYRRTLRYACLLHDIGHTPFSHVCEAFIGKDTLCKEIMDNGLSFGKGTLLKLKNSQSHVLLSCSIVLSEYSGILKELKIDPLDVCAIILGQIRSEKEGDRVHYDVLKSILDSPIDVDKLDYLLRDNYVTGVTLVSLDRERLVESYTVTDNTLSLSGKAISTIANLIHGRESMYMWVYQHHKVVFTDNLLKMIITNLIDEGVIDSENFFTKEKIIEDLLDDYDIINIIRKNKNRESINNLYKMWRERSFLKSCWKSVFDFKALTSENSTVRAALKKKCLENPKEVEEEIRKYFELKQDDVVVTHAQFSPFKPANVDININLRNKTMSVGQDFDIVNQQADFYSNIPYVYVPKEYVDKCNDFLISNVTKFPF